MPPPPARHLQITTKTGCLTSRGICAWHKVWWRKQAGLDPPWELPMTTKLQGCQKPKEPPPIKVLADLGSAAHAPPHPTPGVGGSTPWRSPSPATFFCRLGLHSWGTGEPTFLTTYCHLLLAAGNCKSPRSGLGGPRGALCVLAWNLSFQSVTVLRCVETIQPDLLNS